MTALEKRINQTLAHKKELKRISSTGVLDARAYLRTSLVDRMRALETYAVGNQERFRAPIFERQEQEQEEFESLLHQTYLAEGNQGLRAAHTAFKDEISLRVDQERERFVFEHITEGYLLLENINADHSEHFTSDTPNDTTTRKRGGIGYTHALNLLPIVGPGVKAMRSKDSWIRTKGPAYASILPGAAGIIGGVLGILEQETATNLLALGVMLGQTSGYLYDAIEPSRKITAPRKAFDRVHQEWIQNHYQTLLAKAMQEQQSTIDIHDTEILPLLG